MKNIFYFISIILFAQNFANAQSNIVLNPSLENHYDTSEIGGPSFLRLFVTDWSDPNVGTSDYFLPNSRIGSATPPNNFAGFEYPHSGYCYGGFIILERPASNTYEYVQASFSNPMVAGQVYAIESFVSLMERSVCVSDLGFYFSDTSVYFFTGARLPLTPQYTNPDVNMITTKLGWQRITGSYTAHGGERFVSIGNFLPYGASHVDTCISLTDSFLYAAYLFIDDLAVYDTSKVDTINLCMNDSVELGGAWRKSEGLYTDFIGGLPVRFYILPRPYSTQLTIIEKPFLAGDSVRISLLQKGGIDSSIFAYNVNFLYIKSDTTIDIPMYNIYGCDSTVRYIFGTNISIVHLSDYIDWHIYPNPANNFIEVKISNADRSRYNISIVDIAGRVIAMPASNTARIDISSLQSGLYFVRLADIKSGKVMATEKFVKE